MAPRCKLVAARTLFYVVLLSLAHTAKSQTGYCAAGYQDTDSGVGTVCAQCARGYYKSTPGTGTCSRCPEDTYNNAMGAIECTDCPSNTNTRGIIGKRYVVDCLCNVGYTGPNGGPCDECEAGKYKYTEGDEQCYDCWEGTYSDSAATECIVCPEGTFSATTVASSCTECAAGKFTEHDASQSCTACPEGKTSPVGSSNAAQCVSPPPTTSTTVVVQAASANITFEPLNCVACAAGFYLSPASLNCTACPEGSSTFAYRNASSALHCVCRPGFENQTILGLDGEKCESCRPGFFKEKLANASCARCPANSWTLGDGSANVSACVCDPGFSKPPGPEDHARPCEACAPGSFKRTQADEACSTCLADHFCPAASVEPTACPANSSAAPGRAAVEECLCHAGFHFARDEAGAFFCQPCARGFYNELANQSACVACPANTFNPDTTAPSVARCRACDAHAAAPSASFAIEACACNLGYAGEPGQTCEACEPGTFRENSSSYICEACPGNTYNDVLHASSRDACLACHGNTSSAPGSGSQRACVCDPGLSGVLLHGGTDGVYECTPCAAGTFAEAANSSVCDACPAGKFSASVGAADAATCQACAEGSVALELGLTACTPCGASTWQNTSVPGHLALPCEACPANASHAQESVVDVFTCVCAPGVYKLPLDFASETFRCALCEPGARCPGADRMEDCPFNTFAVGGVVTECTPCAEHSRAATSAPLANPAQCQCVPGAQGGFHEDCALCAAGKFQPLDLTFNGTGQTGVASAVATVCQPCAENHFQPQSGATACVPCHANSSSGAGSDAAADCTCDAGFVGFDGDDCRLCEPGRFCPGGEVSVPCRLFASSAPGASQEAQCSCVAGYYSANATDPCQKCPPGAWCAGGLGYVPCANASTSAAGARAVQECYCEPGFWRGCTRTQDSAGHDAGFVNASGQPCVLDFEHPCVQCGPNDVCVNDTLLHCPEHSLAPAGSDDARDCVCEGGYRAEY